MTRRGSIETLRRFEYRGMGLELGINRQRHGGPGWRGYTDATYGYRLGGRGWQFGFLRLQDAEKAAVKAIEVKRPPPTWGAGGARVTRSRSTKRGGRRRTGRKSGRRTSKRRGRRTVNR